MVDLGDDWRMMVVPRDELLYIPFGEEGTNGGHGSREPTPPPHFEPPCVELEA